MQCPSPGALWQAAPASRHMLSSLEVYVWKKETCLSAVPSEHPSTEADGLFLAANVFSFRIHVDQFSSDHRPGSP